jgi:ABC-type multidrug transport system fused ATPase/permease subunit
LDNASEAVVQKALDKASKGRTTIIIAHRLSTVKDSDVLFVVDKGVVAESGSHNELLSRKGLYHKLVSIQLMEEQEKQAKTVVDYEATDVDIIEQSRKMSVLSVKSNQSSHSNKSAVEFEQQHVEEEPLPTRALLHVFGLNKEKWPFLVFGLIGGLLVGTTWPVFSILLGLVVEGLINPADVMTPILKATYGMVGLGGSACITVIISVYLLRYFGESLALKLREKAYAAMLRQEIGWFDSPDNQVGALTSKLVDESSKVKLASGTALVNIAAAVSSVVCSLVIALTSSWQLGLTILPIMPLTIIAGAAQGYLNTTYEMRSHKRTEESGRIASEAVDKIRTLAALTKEFYFLDKYMHFFNIMKKEARKRANIIGFSWAFLYGCQFSIVVIVFGFGVWLVSQDLMQFEVIFRILIITLMTCADVGRANSNVPEMTSSATAAAKLLQLLNRKPLIDVDDDSGLKPENCSGEVAVHDVSFCYPTRFDTVVLRKFSVTASRGQSVAIVGPSGSGKTTVVQLIERFYDVLAGVVTVDGHDIRELNVSWLRSQMAIVLQDPLLFAISVAENIAYGDNSRHISMDEIIAAAKEANIHSFVTSLPNGYETNVGSKGTQLSGGQKQRVSIARALIRNPKILLLDDATSALDSHSESIVEEALEKARNGRTSIIIAHRLSSIVNANVILYVDRGCVLEKGTHAELMALKRHYYGLYQANLGNKQT